LVSFCFDASGEFFVYFACVLYYSACAKVDCACYVALRVLFVEDGAEFVDAFVKEVRVVYSGDQLVSRWFQPPFWL